MPPPPDPTLVAAGAYDLKDREIAAEVDAIAFAISVRRDSGIIDRGSREGRPSTGFLMFRDVRLPFLSQGAVHGPLSGSCRNVRFVTRAGECTV
jgi:hypothetical protein